MMLRKRLTALEGRACAGELSLAVRAWLGHQLSPTEIQRAAAEAAEPVAIVWSKLSKEAREWLQV